MSERKNMKDSKTINSAKEFLELLQTIPDGKPDNIDIKVSIQKCIYNLKIKDARIFSILSICELVRITKTSDFLDETQLNILFDSVLKCLFEKNVDLSKFISCGIVSQFKNKSMILKFIESFTKIIHNKESLRELIAVMIENSDEKDKFVELIVRKCDHYSDLISRISNLINIDKLDEDSYVKIYCKNQFFRENTTPKIVKGKKRLEYVKSVVSTNLEFTLNNYIRDRDKRIRIILADNIQFHNEPFLSILMNDSDEDVRNTLIKRFSYRNIPESIYERILDKSSKIRNELFRIYKEIVGYLNMHSASKNLNIFERPQSNVLDFPCDSNDDEFDEVYAKFMRFLKKIFEGCLTGVSAEYVSVIDQSKFTLNFLSENKEMRGMRAYLETRPITDYKLIPQHLRSFCLDFMFKGIIPSSQIRDCIQCDIFQVLKFIGDPHEYFDILVEKALTLEDLCIVEKITEFIKPVLKFKDPIFKKRSEESETIKDTVIDDSGHFMTETGISNSYQFSIPNELFINAHTKLDDMFVEHNIMNMSDFPHFYFMVYKLSSKPDIAKNIKESSITISEKIRLIVYLNKTEAVEEFSDVLLKYQLDPQTESFLLSSKNGASVLIYFLCTGLVSLSNPSFFIKAIKCCLKASKNDKITQIFQKYMRSLSQDVFDLFYTICWMLKNCAISNPTVSCKSNDERKLNPAQEESIILNPLLVDNSKFEDTNLMVGIEDTKLNIDTENELNINFDTENELNLKDTSKKSILLKLTLQDKMLHFICNVVISSREGKLLNVKFDPEKYGFFKLQDHHIEMIGYNQVTYE